MLASAHGVELGQLALRAAARDLVAGEGVRLDGAQPGHRPPLGAARRRRRVRRGVRAAARDDGPTIEAERRRVRGARRAARRPRATTPAADLGEHGRAATHGRDGSRPGSCRRCSGDRVLVEYGVLDGEVLAAVVTPARVTVRSVAPVAILREELDPLGVLAPHAPAPPRRTADARSQAGPGCARERVARLRRLLVDPLAPAARPGGRRRARRRPAERPVVGPGRRAGVPEPLGLLLGERAGSAPDPPRGRCSWPPGRGCRRPRTRCCA